MLGLEPGHMQWLLLAIINRAEAHEGAHLVHVAPHGLGHRLRAQAVDVQWITPQGGFMPQPPQQAIHQSETQRVAMQLHLLAKLDKGSRRRDVCLRNLQRTQW